MEVRHIGLRSIVVLLVLLLSIPNVHTFVATSTNGCRIIINEIMYNPEGADSGYEWIEIFNCGVSAVNINGWKLFEGGHNYSIDLVQGDFILNSGEYAIIAVNGSKFLEMHHNFSGTVYDSFFRLNNDGDYIALKDDMSNIIDEVWYQPIARENFSIERDAFGNWKESLFEGGTPGERNSCVKEMSISKKVWNGSAWVDHLDITDMGKLRFNITIVNSGEGNYVVYDIHIKDFLPNFLRYSGNSTINGQEREPDCIDNGSIYWFIPWSELHLGKRERLFLEFDTKIIGCGNGLNEVEVNASYCDPNIDYIVERDNVTIVCNRQPSIDLEKKVWDEGEQSWVDEVYAEVGEEVRFNITIENNGTCCDLGNVTVVDTLPCSLEYVTCSAVPSPYQIDGKTLIWKFDELRKGEKKYIEFRARVMVCGEVDVNVANVTAYCNVTDEWVWDEDGASLIKICDMDINVDKRVWNGSAWVDNLRVTDFDFPLRFNISVKNTGNVEIEMLVINDTFGDCIRNLSGFSYPYTELGENFVTWEINDHLQPNGTIYIEYTAVLLCDGLNLVTVKAFSPCDTISRSDTLIIEGYKPSLSVDPLTIDLGRIQRNSTLSFNFNVWNSGSGELIYNISTSCDYITVFPMNGTSYGENDTIEGILNTSNLSQGNYTCYIYISSNGGEKILTIHFEIGETSVNNKPIIRLLKPEEGRIYLLDRCLPLKIKWTFILGPITIRVNATDPDGYIDRVEFFVDNESRFNDTYAPYEWKWNEKAIGMKEIKVVAYDNEGSSTEEKIEVFIINLGLMKWNQEHTC